jgi:hypothetical protein
MKKLPLRWLPAVLMSIAALAGLPRIARAEAAADEAAGWVAKWIWKD